MSSDLRSSLIRLAHAQPQLRPYLLPLIREKEAMFADDAIMFGDRVRVRTSKGEVEATVVETRPLRSGNTEVRFTAAGGRDLKFTASGWTYATNALTLKLVSRQGAAEVAEISSGAAERKKERDEAREDFVEKGRAALDQFDPRPGDQVTIEYRGGLRKRETVNGVNWKTGKVGVVKETRMSPEERERMEAAFWQMNQATGYNVRPPAERDTRWIPAHQIVAVERLKKPLGS